MRAPLVLIAALASAASLITAVPASAAPPPPVQDVTVTSSSSDDVDIFATISWSLPPEADGGRACAKQGVHPAAEPTACDVYFDSSTPTAALRLTSGKTYTFSVFAYTGPPSAREFSEPVTTQPWHGSKLRFRYCSFPTYGERCRFDAFLTDTRLDTRVQGAKIELWRGVPKFNPDWQLFATDRTDGDGNAHVPVALREEHYFQWRFQGVERILASATSNERIRPRIRVTAHLTHSTAAVGEKVKLYGIVRPALDGLHVALVEYQTTPCRSWQSTGQRVKATRQRLPNGRTTFGYVMTISRSTPGTHRFEVTTDSADGLQYGISDRVALTVSSGAARGTSRSAPGVPGC